MAKRLDYKEGQLIAALTFLEDIPNTLPRKALFLCTCGIKFIAKISHVKNGNTKSCGCLKKTLHDGKFIIHGDKTRNIVHYLYSTWLGIKKRCNNKNAINYKYYGGRGITIFKPWSESYGIFKSYIMYHLGERPEGHSLDRINNDKGYEPNNLRWASNSEQCRNKRKYGTCK